MATLWNVAAGVLVLQVFRADANQVEAAAQLVDRLTMHEDEAFRVVLFDVWNTNNPMLQRMYEVIEVRMCRQLWGREPPACIV